MRRAAGRTGEITLESAETGGMLQIAAGQDGPVSGSRARRVLGRQPRHASFTDDPARYHRAWKAARSATWHTGGAGARRAPHRPSREASPRRRDTADEAGRIPGRAPWRTPLPSSDTATRSARPRRKAELL
ncbi:hypothetical protein [Streptomyces sp. NPDC052701]|uniref:hypothetical protein n=1 Tax=Streptomyces sp. NPDC052701 TaxID=3155533 RepID=UPI00341B3C1D